MPDLRADRRALLLGEETRRCCGRPGRPEEAGFFNCWTRKEAYLKAVGEGLAAPLDSFDVTLAPGEPPRMLALKGDPGRAAAGSTSTSTRTRVRRGGDPRRGGGVAGAGLAVRGGLTGYGSTPVGTVGNAAPSGGAPPGASSPADLTGSSLGPVVGPDPGADILRAACRGPAAHPRRKPVPDPLSAINACLEPRRPRCRGPLVPRAARLLPPGHPLPGGRGAGQDVQRHDRPDHRRPGRRRRACPALAGAFAGLSAADLNQALLYSPGRGHPGGAPALAGVAAPACAPAGAAPSSLPLVTVGLTHGLSLVADLFGGEGRAVAIPQPFWGNYRQTFATRTGAGVLHRARPTSTAASTPGRSPRPWPTCRRASPRWRSSTCPRTPAATRRPSRSGGRSASPCSRSRSGRPLVVVCDDAYAGLVYEPEVPRASMFWELVGRPSQPGAGQGRRRHQGVLLLRRPGRLPDLRRRRRTRSGPRAREQGQVPGALDGGLAGRGEPGGAAPGAAAGGDRGARSRRCGRSSKGATGRCRAALAGVDPGLLGRCPSTPAASPWSSCPRSWGSTAEQVRAPPPGAPRHRADLDRARATCGSPTARSTPAPCPSSSGGWSAGCAELAELAGRLTPTPTRPCSPARRRCRRRGPPCGPGGRRGRAGRAGGSGR